jgi:hypothetical protein
MIDIEPVSIDQIARGRGGRMIVIESDVGDIAKQIMQLHPDFFVRYNDQGEYFAVLQNMGPGHRPHVVSMAQKLDQRLLDRVRRVMQPDYDPGAEAEAYDRQVDAANDAQFADKVGEVSEKLAWAIREDIRKSRPGPVYVPPDILPNRRFRK